MVELLPEGGSCHEDVSQQKPFNTLLIFLLKSIFMRQQMSFLAAPYIRGPISDPFFPILLQFAAKS